MNSHIIDRNNWIDSIINKHPNADVEILSFIHTLTETRNADEASTIIKFYTSGYCYHFAKMLEDAFEGQVMWLYDRSHMVFMAKNRVCYDAYGVFNDYQDDELCDLHELTQRTLAGFRKTKGWDISAIHRGYEISDIIWILFEDGVLSICGHGELLKSYKDIFCSIYIEEFPWKAYDYFIRRIEIAANVRVPKEVMRELVSIYESVSYETSG